MNLNNLFESQLSDDVLAHLSESTGIGDKEETAKAAKAVFSTMVGAISRNASTPEGAESLANALDKDHDGGILNDVMGYITGSQTPENSATTNGSGILNHVLGDKQEAVTSALSKITNLDSSQLSGLMEKLAPMIMGVLGKTKQESGADSGTFSNILGSILGSQSGDNPIMNVVTSIFDKDGDGNVMDDVLGDKIGGMLGGLFNKK